MASTSWASPNTSTASPRRLTLAPPLLGALRARRYRRLLHVRARADRPAARHRGRFHPGREEHIAGLLEARSFDYVVGSVHFLGDRPSTWTTSASGSLRARRRRSLGALLRDGRASARSGLFDIIAHPDLVKFWGDAGRVPGGRPAPLLRAGVEASPRPGSPSSSRPRACASRPASSIPRPPSWRCASRRGSRWRSRATPTGPRTSARPTSRRWSCSSVLGVGELARLRTASARRRHRAHGRARRYAPELVGIGYDCHRLVEGRPLVLGGIEIAHERGPGGPLRRRRAGPRRHRRVAGGGRAGRYRPALPRHRRALAGCRLDRAAASGGGLLAERDFGPVNVDCTVIIEAPALSPHRERIQARLADALGLGRGRVNVKARPPSGWASSGQAKGRPRWRWPPSPRSRHGRPASGSDAPSGGPRVQRGDRDPRHAQRRVAGAESPARGRWGSTPAARPSTGASTSATPARSWSSACCAASSCTRATRCAWW